MKLRCKECNEVIAVFTADTKRKSFEQKRQAVCEYCFGNREEDMVEMKCPTCKERYNLPKNTVQNGDRVCGLCSDDYNEGPILQEVDTLE